ncbi:MAG: hypothetical protein EA394_01885 [Bacteroidia bacterium]|nr:MAG: hypothetical protein EA394_01885 [Bacteroidia bacterium]
MFFEYCQNTIPIIASRSILCPGVFLLFQYIFIFLGFVFVSGDTEMAALLLRKLHQGDEAQKQH